MSNFHGLKKLTGIDHFCSNANDQHTHSDRFGRMFPDLPPLYTAPKILNDLGSKNGPMNGGNNANRTSTVDVGQVFFGQFVDHDITLDTSSSLTAVNNPSDIENVRTPTLDLDCIYGQGPEASPFMYVQNGAFAGVKLLTGADVNASDPLISNDLVRSVEGTAIIGDPRNDENRIISQLQLAMIRFHNKTVDKLSSSHEGHELFEEARGLVTRHYHWCLLYDFLPSMCGNAVVWDILKNGRQHYCLNEVPFIPVEFSVAAYRFGHSMAPQKIQVQKSESSHTLFGGVLGKGFTPVLDEKAIVDFHELFTSSENRQVQKSEKLDTQLAPILLDLPFVTSGESSLATRNLLRGQSFLLPAGEVLAEKMGRSESEIDKVSTRADQMSGNQLAGKTPLWCYLLAEAEVIGRESEANHFDKGEGLGPVGARIVAEVMIGLMELDSHSFLAMDRSWQPKDGLGEEVASVGAMLTYTP